MIVRNDQDWAAWDFANLQALQLSTRQTLLGIAPYLERLQSGRDDLRELQVDGLLFFAVELIEGVLVDPALPAEFENLVSQQHTDVCKVRWWNRPFIERCSWEGPYGLEVSHRASHAAIGKVFPELAARDVEKHIAALKALWFSDWPTGVRYEVCCFDSTATGGLTSWGTFNSIPEALGCIMGGRRW